MRELTHRCRPFVLVLLLLAGLWPLVSAFLSPAGSDGPGVPAAQAQEELIVRPGPPPLDQMESDANGDGVPDGWYNAS